MSPATAVAQVPAAPKMKRPVPPGIQTNGTIASTSSPSPSLANKKTPNAAKQPSTTPSTDRPISASTGRPIIRVRRDPNGRHSRNSAGIRTGEAGGDGAKNHGPMPYVVTDSYVLKKHAGSPPSLVAHLHATHFRFDGQDGMFPYKSPMKLFLEHVRSRTIPHDLLPYLVQANVPFYDGCLIVQLHDHKSAAQSKDETVTASKTKTVASSIHNYNPWLTPSPYVPFPTDQQHGADENADAENKLKSEGEGDAVAPLPENKSKPPTKAKVFTVVLHPTPESLQYDLMLKATTAKPSGGDGAGPPSTPLSLVPPTPTAGNMPPPAKRAKKEKTELDGSTIYAAEGQILLATTAPLMLEPTKSAEETAALLEAMAHPKNSDPLPEPNSRKRTVAEVAADEAAAAEQERYMLVLDERLSSSANGAQGAGADGDAQTGGAAFEPRFERFKLINDIIRDHAEKKEQEKIKQQENDKRLQQQRQQQQEQMVAQRQADMERARQAAAAREAQAQAQAHQQQQAQAAEAQRQAMAARQAAAVQAAANNAQNMAQAHGHPGAMPNGVNAAAQAMGAQQRFPQQMQAAQASSPVVRQPTPQNMSSPMVGSAPMQQTNSGMAGSPPRPPSAAPGAMSAPMAPSMSVRGSQQSHTAGTPRMPNATPNMSQATPINRGQMNATPRMSQASPPPNMMAQNSQMGQNMMMQAGQNMSPPNPQVIAQLAAQQRHLAQQHQMAAMQNGGAGGVPNMNNMSQQQQQQMLQIMQRQFAMQQQQQAQAAQQQQQAGMMNPQQQQQWAQYAQQLQNMQGNQMRQMTPQMQAQLQAQMARMGQVPAGAAMPNAAMQRQMSAQMMNGNNANMQNMAMQMQQQQQQQQQAQQQGQQFVQQQGQQMPMGQQQPGMQQNLIQQQLNNSARTIYQKLMASAAARFGSTENIPPETIEKLKAASMSQAQQMLQASIAQRRAQQMMQQQQQQQQQQAMQGMGGMMGQQGMQ